MKLADSHALLSRLAVKRHGTILKLVKIIHESNNVELMNKAQPIIDEAYNDSKEYLTKEDITEMVN